ncbi:hypothetical protein B0H13DRAFT_1609383 [Mycena leptocephala]|nr:hypothetical protein B0H13DRAFT_1631481 [Mycena leptocephala]KAJ7916454.1 hypothetical protein B0H13DRAFT_1609383 [Mycena leptocephala]
MTVKQAHADFSAQVPADALFMLLPLWPGSTDPVSDRNTTRLSHEIPTEQRQHLLVSYNPTTQAHSSTNSSGDAGSRKGCDILLTSYDIGARLVSHSELQSTDMHVPTQGLAVLGSWSEAWLSMPQLATHDYGLVIIGTYTSREAGVRFNANELVKMGLFSCIRLPPDAGTEEVQEEPVAELTPIGRAVLELAWIGGIAVTSFGPAGSS